MQDGKESGQRGFYFFLMKASTQTDPEGTEAIPGRFSKDEDLHHLQLCEKLSFFLHYLPNLLPIPRLRKV